MKKPGSRIYNAIKSGDHEYLLSLGADVNMRDKVRKL